MAIQSSTPEQRQVFRQLVQQLGYTITEDNVLWVGIGDNKTPIGSYIRVCLVKQNTKTNQVTLLIEYWVPQSRSYRTAEVTPDVLTKQGIQQLLNLGVDINPDPDATDALIVFLFNTYRNAPYQYVAPAPRWETIDGNTVYISSEGYGPVQINATSNQDRFNTLPIGDVNNVVAMLAKVLPGNLPLQIIVSVALAALFVPLLFEKAKLVTALLLVQLTGQSTTGKTTAAKLATSFFGDISNLIGTLMGNWAGTPRSRTLKLSDMNGFLVTFDELGASSDNDLTSLIYQLSLGVERERAQGDGTLQDQKSWSGAVISTSEFPLSDKTSELAGLKARYLELNGVQFTKSAEEASFIQETVTENHGVVIPTVVKHIFDNYGTVESFEHDMFAVFDGFVAKAESMVADQKLKTRVGQNIAAIATGAHYLSQVFPELGFVDADAVMSAVAQETAGQFTDDDPVEKAYQSLQQELLSRNGSVGVLHGEHRWVPNSPIAYVDGMNRLPAGETQFQVFILKTTVEQVLRRNGHTNPRTVIKGLEEAGYMVRMDGDRLQTRRSIEGQRVNVYTFNMPVTMLPMLSAVSRAIDPTAELEHSTQQTLRKLPGYPGMDSESLPQQVEEPVAGLGPDKGLGSGFANWVPVPEEELTKNIFDDETEEVGTDDSQDTNE